MSEVSMNLDRQKRLLNGTRENVFISTEIQNKNFQQTVKCISGMSLHDRPITGGQFCERLALWEKLQTLPETP